MSKLIFKKVETRIPQRTVRKKAKKVCGNRRIRSKKRIEKRKQLYPLRYRATILRQRMVERSKKKNKNMTKKKKQLKITLDPNFLKSIEKIFSNNLKYLIPRKLKDCKYQIKWAVQRIFRGYDDTTIWNLHSTLAEVLPKIIRELKDNLSGCPGEIFDNKAKKNKECHIWKEILEKMANGFDAAKKIDDNVYMKEIKLKKSRKNIFNEDTYTDYKFDKKYYNKLHKEFEEGIDLFKKHFFSLWD